MRTGSIPAFVLSCMAIPYAWAVGNIDPTNKHAWAENTGWVNALPSNGVVTVTFDGTSGYVSGLAWGENIGWIKLGADSGGPYANSSATNWGVNLDEAAHLSGYAWGENVGWIKFSPAHSGVSIDMVTGRFDGFAWGENIGWLHFKGSQPDYNVRTLAFDTQPAGTPNWWLATYGVAEDFDEGDHVPAWQEFLADTDPTNPASYFRIEAISNGLPATVFFPSSARRYYTLQGCSNLTTGVWTNVEAQIAIHGAGGLQSLADATATTQRSYRVQVSVSP